MGNRHPTKADVRMINGHDYDIRVYKLLAHNEKNKMKRDYRRSQRMSTEIDAPETIRVKIRREAEKHPELDENPDEIRVVEPGLLTPHPERWKAQPVYPVQNGKQRLQKILDGLKQDGEAIQKKSEVNDTRLQRLRTVKFFAALLASAGISSTAGLAVSISSLSLSAAIALPVTVSVVVGTVIAGGFGVTCHHGIRYLEKRSVRINAQAQLVRTTEKEIFDKYLMDEHVTARELSQLLEDVDRYHRQQEEIAMRKYVS